MATVNKDFKVKNNISIVNTADTATAASHYIVETGTDGIIRPKTLANVRTEIVTTASVNAAAATTVGTITSGTWQGSVIGATYIDSAIARLASPTFTGTLTAATGAFTGSVNMNHNTQTRPASGSGVTINWNWTGGQADVDFWNVYTPATTAFVFKQLTGASTHTDLLTIFSNGNATLNGTLTATSYSGGASLTGTPTAPTATAGTNTTQIATTEFVQTAVNNVNINTQTASYQLVLADAGKVVEMNVGTANNLTVPPNSTVAYPIGTTIDVVQYGAGQTTLVAGSGVTIRAKDNGLKFSGRYSAVSLYKRGTDEWVAMGDLTV